LITFDQGDYVEAQVLGGQALTTYRELEDTFGIANTLNNVGWLGHVLGDDERAVALLEESIALCRQLRVVDALIYPLNSLGMVLVECGKYRQAQELLTEGLSLARQTGNREHVMYYLEAFAWMAAPLGAAHGQPAEGARRAARLFGAAEALSNSLSAPLLPDILASHTRHAATARTYLDDGGWEAAWAEGRTMSLEQAIACAVGIEQWG